MHRRSSYRPGRPGLHFILKNEKNQKSKFAIKIEGLGFLKVVKHRSQNASECTI